MTAQLPTITEAVLDQWEGSAEQDVERGVPWTTNPLAILAVIRDLRAARARHLLIDGETLERAIADSSPLLNARLSEIDWNAVASRLQVAELDVNRLAAVAIVPYADGAPTGRCLVCGEDGSLVGELADPETLAARYAGR